MKLLVDRFAHEPPGLSIIPETDYEAALLSRYWETSKLSKGRANTESKSADGFCYSLKFQMEDSGKAKDQPK